MRVLLLGGGGREHALAWKLAQSSRLTELVMAPGNPGMAELGTILTDLDINDPQAVASAADAQAIDLVVVGPEAPLAAGVADALHAAGVSVFGPTKAAAKLEWSKTFASDVMRRAGVPTGQSYAFTGQAAAHAHLESIDGPFVVKADGLAAGKGVLVTDDRTEAIAWSDALLSGRFGAAGSTVVCEEFLAGSEISIFAICDGETAVPLVPARDYKRRFDGDAGPNTGGMGSYSPVDDLPDGLVAWTMDNVMYPMLRTMAADGTPFVGFLYAGLMLTESGPKVLEFNVRLGDPETQVVMVRLYSDLLASLWEAANGQLSDTPLAWSDAAVVNVVLASKGYPEDPETGFEISGITPQELPAT